VRLLSVVFADVPVPCDVFVQDADGAVHPADGDDGAGFQGRGVGAEAGWRLGVCAGGFGCG
jgi:hypothetical protein